MKCEKVLVCSMVNPASVSFRAYHDIPKSYAFFSAL